VKLFVTVIKYCPQAWVNYKRKSTIGWSISQILFDLAGGFLSLAQLIIDASFQNDWSGVTGNPLKLLLANISIFFDLVFVVQHYILYRGSSDGEGDSKAPDSRTPLLSEEQALPIERDGH
jgi:cystinosin